MLDTIGNLQTCFITTKLYDYEYEAIEIRLETAYTNYVQKSSLHEIYITIISKIMQIKLKLNTIKIL